MFKVGIVGASGYAGGELLRLLLYHPKVKIQQITSQQFAGLPVGLVHPNLRNQTNINFVSLAELKACDLLFVALPNGLSMKFMDKLIHLAPKIIDCGADFRLKTAKESELIGKFIYGLPELHREEIKKAKYIAGPGCEATVSILSLWPLVKHNIIEKKVIIDAKMASSQAGNKPTNSSHHPERAGVVRSYMPTGHRHTAEIEQELEIKNQPISIFISATAVELVRGIVVTIQTFLKQKLTETDIWQIYQQEYQDEPFIRIIKQKQGLYRYPEPKILSGTNFCEIGFEKENHTKRLVVIGAIDNLGKGTAGNAVQCMNLMMGFKETVGLEFPGLHPL